MSEPVDGVQKTAGIVLVIIGPAGKNRVLFLIVGIGVGIGIRALFLAVALRFALAEHGHLLGRAGRGVFRLILQQVYKLIGGQHPAIHKGNDSAVFHSTRQIYTLPARALQHQGIALGARGDSGQGEIQDDFFFG